VPDWFPELVEKVAKLRLTRAGSIELVRDADFSELVDRLRKVPVADYYTRLGRWFLADPARRPASPFGTDR